MKYFIYCRKSTESEDRQVLSIDSQYEELRKKFDNHPDIEIVDTHRESFSAKAPGRSVFDQMLKHVEKGHAQGIIAWHPDRLARNSIDGGRIIYLLDTNKLRDLKFANFTFENNPQGKFMLSIIFGYSKYYVDALSENVKRGNRAKVERGWRPSMAPIGYKNDKETKTTIPDPDHFPIVRRLFGLALTGLYDAADLCRLVRDEWHYRTPKHKRMGGKPLAPSTLYRLLGNPFYAGYFRWEGQLHQGKHQAMISLDDFDRLQEAMGRKNLRRPIKHAFPYTGLMRCGNCDLSITAETTVNRHGASYTYYHCTKRALGPRCNQPYVPADDLQKQMKAFLATAAIASEFEDWIRTFGVIAERDSRVPVDAVKVSLSRAVADLERQASTLTDLRLQGYIEEDEFKRRHATLRLELETARERVTNVGPHGNWFESVEKIISFSKCAATWFLHNPNETGRIIFKAVGSNPQVTDKKLTVRKTKPFFTISEAPENLNWCTTLRDVRTMIVERDPETMTVLGQIKDIEQRMKLTLLPLFPGHTG